MPKTRKKLPLLKSFMLTQEDKDNLNEMTARHGDNQSAAIRTALREWFARNGLTVTETE